jgi:hypothetical protein
LTAVPGAGIISGMLHLGSLLPFAFPVAALARAEGAVLLRGWMALAAGLPVEEALQPRYGFAGVDDVAQQFNKFRS